MPQPKTLNHGRNFGWDELSNLNPILTLREKERVLEIHNEFVSNLSERKINI
jgi:hypothetical protein